MTSTDKPKHTPGPWQPPHLCDDTTTCNCTSIVEGGYAGGIASVHVHNGIDSISEGGNDAPPLEEAKANGHLIAAAPELYEACRVALKFWHSDHPNDYPDGIEAHEYIKAAIAKAEGRS